jgi:hypothetical protein
MLDDARVLPEERRHDFVPDPNPFIRPLVVRGVFDEGKAALLGIGEDIGAATIEKWADHSVGSACFDPA